MIQNLKKRLKNQKGFTLIELLAVIVILGILAAIAVPSILGIINNSKMDAHVANAQQMISAAKMLIASDSTYQTDDHFVTLYGLEHLNYLDPVESPEGKYLTGEDKTNPDVVTITDASNSVSYVEINNGKVVGINLITDTTPAKYIRIPGDGVTAISTKDLKRGEVKSS